LHPSQVSVEWPNALRWFLAQQLQHFTPWHFIDKPSAGALAARAFSLEDINRREVFVFAHRQDCDDFAGLQIVDGRITDRVIYFHPSFGSNVPEWDIVNTTFEDVFDFVAKRVLPDMKDWASTEDASELSIGATE
jgi:hypothetical protein